MLWTKTTSCPLSSALDILLVRVGLQRYQHRGLALLQQWHEIHHERPRSGLGQRTKLCQQQGRRMVVSISLATRQHELGHEEMYRYNFIGFVMVQYIATLKSS